MKGSSYRKQSMALSVLRKALGGVVCFQEDPLCFSFRGPVPQPPVQQQRTFPGRRVCVLPGAGGVGGPCRGVGPVSWPQGPRRPFAEGRGGDGSVVLTRDAAPDLPRQRQDTGQEGQPGGKAGTLSVTRGDNGRGLAACGETYCEQMLREVTRGSRGRRKLVLPGLGSALAPEPGSGWQESRLPSSASEAGGPGSRHGRGRRLLKPCPCCVEAVPPCVLTRSSLRVSVA